MPRINGKYYTDREVEEIKQELDEDAFDKFMVSGVIGLATGSALAGGLLGGSLLGGVVGPLLGDDDDSSDDDDWF